MGSLDDVKKLHVIAVPNDEPSGSMEPVALFNADGTAFPPAVEVPKPDNNGVSSIFTAGANWQLRGGEYYINGYTLSIRGLLLRKQVALALAINDEGVFGTFATTVEADGGSTYGPSAMGFAQRADNSACAMLGIRVNNGAQNTLSYTALGALGSAQYTDFWVPAIDIPLYRPVG